MALTDSYAKRIKPLLPKAQKAYGSRDTVSENHAASRQYTKLLVEYYEKGGSLLDLAKELGVTYAGLRRRVTTASLPPMHRTARVKFSEAEYKAAADRLREVRAGGSSAKYHDQIKAEYDRGLSLTVLARELGLSSAHPLYFGLSRSTLRARAQA